jgi:hypothetical protein
VLGLGHYARMQHELLHLSIRGAPGTPPENARDRSIYRERRSQKHSKKPGYYRALIERMYPHARRIELFARECHTGWTAWGNEVTDPFHTPAVTLPVNNVTPDSHTLAVAWRYRMADDPAAGTLISKHGPIDRASVEASLRKQHGRAVVELEPCA